MTKNMSEFITWYWSRNKLGRAMLESETLTDNDLWFMIPNNVKKMHGFKVARTPCKRKGIYKRNKKHFILSFRLYDIISEIIDDILSSIYCNNNFFGEFVDIKNYDMGDNEVKL